MLARAAVPFRLGLTPVFLNNGASVIGRPRGALTTDSGIELVQRRACAEISGMLPEGAAGGRCQCGRALWLPLPAA